MDSSGAIAIFVKTPGLSPVKTRLAAAIGETAAREFYRLALNIVNEVAEDLIRRRSAVRIYWAVAEEAGVSRWQRFPALYQGPGSLGERMHYVYSKLRRQHAFAILIGSDIPTLSAELLEIAVDILADSCAPRLTLGPAGDGGFYLVGGNVDIPLGAWTDTPYSVPETCAVFRQQLSNLGPVSLLAKLSDVDTAADLMKLSKCLALRHIPGGGSGLTELGVWLSGALSHIPVG